LVHDQAIQSKTVLAIQTSTALLDQVKKTALKNGLLLGNGYGAWKNSTFRIANFPSITDDEMKLLLTFFEENFSAEKN
ncbi:MAG: alanine--glyoxylate aminotransferase family protein, partial [Cyclobacteriaceae bacterium]|nr:alanine--glyoxylate aminotransferase family protein [Cyclobacteriaceae bacterium]